MKKLIVLLSLLSFPVFAQGNQPDAQIQFRPIVGCYLKDKLFSALGITSASKEILSVTSVDEKTVVMILKPDNDWIMAVKLESLYCVFLMGNGVTLDQKPVTLGRGS